MADFYSYGLTGFPFGWLTRFEDFEAVFESPDRVVAQGTGEYLPQDYTFEFIGSDLEIDESVAIQGEYRFAAFPVRGTLTEVVFTSPSGLWRYVGELDAFGLLERTAAYGSNNDDILINFSRFVFEGDDRIFGGGLGYEGDDTYYFQGEPAAGGYSIGQYMTFYDGVLEYDHTSAGYDTVNFQGLTGGATFSTSESLERIIGSDYSDTLFMSTYATYDYSDNTEVHTVYTPGYVIKAAAGHDTVHGGFAGDSLSGGAGNDVIYGKTTPDWTVIANPQAEGSLDDTIDGGAGADVIYSDVGDDILNGGSGRDAIFANGGADTIDGGTGYDTLDLSLVPDGAAWSVDLSAGVMIELRDGTPVQSEIRDVEAVVGSAGDDSIRGSDDGERFQGGAGADMLKGGGGRDVFVYADVADSTLAGRDRILDFRPGRGEAIDLSAIDAAPDLADDQAFAFIGEADFSGAGGEIRVSYRETGDAVLTVDIDGDLLQDMNILLRNVTAATPLTEADFIL